MLKKYFPSLSRSEWWLTCLLLIPFVPYVYKLISPFFIIAGLGAYTWIINPAILWIGILGSLNRIIRSCRISDVFFFVLICCSIVISALIFPETRTFFKDNYIDFITYVLPCYYIGLIINYDRDKNVLYFISYIGIFVILFWQVCQLLRLVEVNETSTGALGEQMEQAYMLLFPICNLFVQESKTKLDILMIFIGIALIFMMGTRGPIIILGLFISTYLLFFKKYRKHNFFLKTIITIAIPIFLINIKWISLIAIPIAMSLGFSTRVFDSIVDERFNIKDSSGRDDIYGNVFEHLGSNEGVWGLGWGGDRLITIDNLWTHNFELEILVQFGWIFGGILLLILFSIFFKCLLKTRHKYAQSFLYVMIFAGLMELQLSSTYIRHPLFFVLIGYCISILRTRHFRSII